MPTIDTLDIQIKSTSTQAADGIHKLAVSLGELKENGSVGVAVNNLNKLSNALRKFTGIQSAGHKISALASSMQALKRVGSVTSIASGLGKLGESFKEFEDVSLDPALGSKMQRIADAMSRVSGLKSGGLSTMVNALDKIADVTAKLDDSTINKFADKVARLNEKLAPLSSRMTSIQAGFRAMNTNARSAGKGLKHFGDKVDVATLNMVSLMHVAKGFAQRMRPVISALSEAIGQASEWDGIAARFGRGFGPRANEVYSWIQRLNKEMGINTQQFMQYSSVFSTMLQGFGVGVEDSAKMALGYTELTYDIWAGYNDVYASFADAADAVKSAISGEVEPVRRAGFTIVESTLEQTAANYGLEISLEKATEAQKSYLRYLTLVDQAHAQNLVGSYAREMNTAEGVMRTFAQSIKSLAQALGSLFLPILVKVIPWIQAFVELITSAISAVALFFGVEIQPVDWSGYGDSIGAGVGGGLDEVGDAADSATDAVGGTKKAVEDLKRATLGIDELNIIGPQEDSGGSGSGVGSGGAGGFENIDVDSIWDESIFNQIQSQVDELKPKVEEILKVALSVAGVFAAWKIGKSFFQTMDAVLVFLRAASGYSGVGSKFASLFGDEALVGLQKFMTLVGGTPIGKLLLGSGLSSIGATAAAIAGVVTAVAALATGLALVFAESENFRSGLATLFDGVAWVVTGIVDIVADIGEMLGIMWFTMKEQLASIVPTGVLEFFDALEIGISDLLISVAGFALFGPAGLLIEAVVLGIKGIGYAASDSLQPVDLLGDGISDLTKSKVEPFIDAMGTLDVATKTLDWSNAIVTDADVKTIGEKLKTVTDTILNELDSDRNAALATLDPLKAALGDERFTELMEKVQESYDVQTEQVRAWQDEINSIIKTAQEERRGLTEEESARIGEIQAQMMETGVKYLSESETESNLILQRLRDTSAQLTAEQASEVIKNAINARDETIAAANEQYEGICLEAQRMLDTGTITKDEYDAIISAAEQARDDAVAAAETQYSDILSTAQRKMGEYAKFIDETTGEIKSNWEVWCEDWVGAWKDTWAEVTAWWNENADPLIDTILEGISAIFNPKTYADLWAELTDWWSSLELPSLNFKMPHFSWGTREATGTLKTVMDFLNIPAKIPSLSVSWYANGGFPNVGEMFVAREAGPEMVGKISNKTAVVNNDQIVEAVSEGVYSAVMAAIKARESNGSQSVNVYLDGRMVTQSVERIQRERGASIMGNQVYA